MFGPERRFFFSFSSSSLNLLLLVWICAADSRLGVPALHMDFISQIKEPLYTAWNEFHFFCLKKNRTLYVIIFINLLKKKSRTLSSPQLRSASEAHGLGLRGFRFGITTHFSAFISVRNCTHHLPGHNYNVLFGKLAIVASESCTLWEK